MANTQNVIVNTNYQNGQLTEATGFTAAFGGNTGHSRTLAPNEKVYVTQITVKRDAVLMEWFYRTPAGWCRWCRLPGDSDRP